MIFISGPAIARRYALTRKWAHEHLHRGTFGRTITLNGIIYARLEAVEAYSGEPFSQPQLRAAVADFPDRMIILDGELS
jgi:hypothetical protein